MPHIKPYELTKKWKAKQFDTVYLFSGEETYQQQEALQSLTKILNIDPLNREVFYGSESPVNDVIITCQTMPFLGEKKLVIVKEANKIKTADAGKLAEFLKSTPEFCCLVMMWPGKVKAETKRSALFKAAEKAGSAVEFRTLYDNELPAWIQENIRQSGKRIAPDAVRYLIQESGASLMDLKNEIEKLLLFSSGKNEITLEDVEILSGHTKQVNLNSLYEVIESKKISEALRISEGLLNEGEAALRILSTVYWALRRMLTAKCLLEESDYSQQEVQKELRLHPYFAASFFSRLSKFRLEELKQDISFILDADRRIKSTSQPDNMILEELFVQVCR